MTGTTTFDNVIPRADIVKHADRLGAEIKNITLLDDVSDEIVIAIHQLLLEHKVIFFRDQGHLDDVQRLRFVLRLGSLIPNPTVPDPRGGLTIRKTLGDRACSHVDQTNDDEVFSARPTISVLRGPATPPFGADMAWSSTTAAYLDLPDPLRMLADNLWAVRGATFDHTPMEGATEADKRASDDASTGTIYDTTHPIVRVHPETGERMLSLGRSVQNFIGLQRYPSQRLFELLKSYLTAPENTLCWKWKTGDVAIWDNRATERYTIDKTGSPHRAMNRLPVDAGLPHTKRLKSRAAVAA
ncbi:TauD/TfdA family dioxygenase [Bradyrhizobium sp. NBAIM01]|uniref:TauD/TfdA dioxygenase family protein n=1 Tax=Bradyrhizobium sp. NBAIM01 TaxID=2793818 RepID=UPI001CD40637|nr:TauD/TfdA family dioxygenase [Bradyrhizobium sp. NBAIM01]MCA1510539.1 TauD/TfdA family dioxygenase [Bradyrhizobium sp. NBAIM01]